MEPQASGRRSRAARRLSRASGVSVVALGGCGPAPSAYVPDAVAAPVPNEARFDLRTDERVTGTASVKSSGPYLADVDGRQRTVIAITIDVDNTDGARDLVVDPADLRLAFDATTPRLDGVAPAGSSGRATIAPKTSATLRAHFMLPADVSPGQVERYDLTWALRDGDRVAYQLKTPFVAAASGVAYVGAPPRDVAPAVYYAPYGYWYGGVWYDAHARPYAHHGGVAIVPHVSIHAGPHGWGHSSGVHHGGGHHGGGGHHAP